MNTSSNIIIYQGAEAGVEVGLEQETVWLTQERMGLLFGRDRLVVAKHVHNVFF